MANTDERLKEIIETVEEDICYVDPGEIKFSAQKALEARDALRRIREVASVQPFANSSQRRIWKAAADLCDKILAD